MAGPRSPTRVETARDAANLLAPLFRSARGEKLAVMLLGRERELLDIKLFPGEPTEIDMPLRAIVYAAIEAGAEGLVLAHCHPSGNPHPSRDDQKATRALVQLGRPLGLQVHDHLIFAGEEISSFRALGLL
ncbi:MAG: JAB domain-containing protein [Sphingomonadaceae bacterium]